MMYDVSILPLNELSPRFVAAFCVVPRILSANSTKALSHHLVSIYS